MVLARLAGKSVSVSLYAAKVIKGAGPTGGYRASNGYYTRLTRYYDGPGATLTEACKQLKDGRHIEQKLWSWPDGHTVALTRRSDGFFSYVIKNNKGKVTEKLISRNPNNLVHEYTYNGVKKVPVRKYVNGDSTASIQNGELVYVSNSPYVAQSTVKGAIEEAGCRFRCIG